MLVLVDIPHLMRRRRRSNKEERVPRVLSTTSHHTSPALVPLMLFYGGVAVDLISSST